MVDDNILRMADRAWSGERSVELLPATKFKPQPIHWLWPQWLARGKLHLLAGSSGTGKTTICVSLAAAITRGAEWPGGGQAEPGDVLFWSGEDGIRDTLVPRFLAAGGDPSRLHFAGDVSESGRNRTFDPAEDLRTLIKSARELPELRMVVLDPVVQTITGDSHKNSETRRGLRPVVDMAEELDVAVVGITHLSKGTLGREPLERVIGSIAFAAVARVVLATVKARDPQQPHRLVRAKSNLGPDRGGVEYDLIEAPVPGYDFHAQRVEWGESLEGTALELMSIEEAEEEAEARSEVETFLRDLLAADPMATKAIREAAARLAFKWRTVERAKNDLGIVAVKGGEFGHGWAWQLPGG
jgi:putative DNA primase/helicase